MSHWLSKLNDIPVSSSSPWGTPIFVTDILCTVTAACTGNTYDGSNVYVKYCMYYHDMASNYSYICACSLLIWNESFRTWNVFQEKAVYILLNVFIDLCTPFQMGLELEHSPGTNTRTGAKTFHYADGKRVITF